LFCNKSVRAEKIMGGVNRAQQRESLLYYMRAASKENYNQPIRSVETRYAHVGSIYSKIVDYQPRSYELGPNGRVRVFGSSLLNSALTSDWLSPGSENFLPGSHTLTHYSQPQHQSTSSASDWSGLQLIGLAAAAAAATAGVAYCTYRWLYPAQQPRAVAGAQAVQVRTPPGQGPTAAV
jgi:hypothetical protein